jgi:hypothetical protein
MVEAVTVKGGKKMKLIMGGGDMSLGGDNKI